MKYEIKKSSGIGFANKESYEYEGKKYEADLKNGDKIVILDSGVKEEGKFGIQDNFIIKTRNGDKKLSFNQSTLNVLVQELGDESENWIGKEVKVLLQRKMIAGKKCIIPYLVLDGWEINGWGELAKGTDTQTNPTGEKIPADSLKNNDVPPTKEEIDESINVSEIPF